MKLTAMAAAAVLFMSTGAHAATSLYNESTDGADLDGSLLAFSVSVAGDYTVTGGLNSGNPADASDPFDILLDPGLSVSFITFAVSGSGGATLNNASGPFPVLIAGAIAPGGATLTPAVNTGLLEFVVNLGFAGGGFGDGSNVVTPNYVVTLNVTGGSAGVVPLPASAVLLLGGLAGLGALARHRR